MPSIITQKKDPGSHSPQASEGCLRTDGIAPMAKIIYLDNNATTPCAPEVLAGMLPFFSADFANPSSPHTLGRRAAQHVEKARRQVAACIQCDPSEVIFTSGATESNNLALLGLLGAERRRLLVGAIEHKSVLAPCEMLAKAGFAVEEISVDSMGMIRVEALRERLRPDVLLVSVQAANNEVGTIQPIREVAELAHGVGAIVHCDAAQLLGKIACHVHELGADLASFSGHKVYGPKGVGVLFVKRGLAGRKLMPVFGGGGQEFGFRPGTLNVPGIVGMGIACELAEARLSADAVEIAELRNKLERGILEAVPGTRVNGHLRSRLPGTSNMTIEGIPADALLTNVPEVCFSAGSACTSGAVAPSHVLLGMGLSREDAECSVRMSLGRHTTREDVEFAVARVVRGALTLRTQLQHVDPVRVSETERAARRGGEKSA
jgi:cysteine desulfurase